VQWPLPEDAFEHRSEAERSVPLSAVGSGEAPLLMAAALVDGVATRHFNGKLEAPFVTVGALAPSQLDSMRCDADALRSTPGLIAAWDFAEDFAGTRVVDRGPCGLTGRVINAPIRGVTGHNWSGTSDAFTHVPNEYGAIHFHDDDLEDAGWTPSLTLLLPEHIDSGVYAVKVSGEGHEDYIPFFVRGTRGSPSAPLLFLAPTFSYLAYQNHHNGAVGPSPRAEQPEDDYSAEQRILTLYDRHSDGSGVCYASYLRPLAIPRPAYKSRSTGAVHQLSADLALLRWLEEMGFKYEVATDHDLDAEGFELLEHYRVIVTGSHPEYWSAAMLDAVEAFLARGGRMAYLGGNGFYWVTSVNPARPHLVEVRRGDAGTRTWTSQPGESYHNTTGERGGLWRHRGRAPQRLCGVGFTAWGNGPANPFLRTPESFDPRVAFIFDGVGEDEPIGAEGDVLGGAAGYEIDRADRRLGTPHHALVVAASRRHDIDFHPVAEELEIANFPIPPAPDNPLIRADMVYFETPNGGAVFSTGSITWTGSLAAKRGDNSVARITANVLSRFCLADTESGPWSPR
jgi:N,N-dimethylformamidase